MNLCATMSWKQRQPYDPLHIALANVRGAEVVRRRELLAEPEITDKKVALTVVGGHGPARLTFPSEVELTLASTGPRRRRSLIEYAVALECGRAIDVLGRTTNHGFEPLAFWCAARYDGQRKHGSRKPDPEFVFTLANADKDERIAARFLRGLGHVPTGLAVEEERPYEVTLAAARGGRPQNADLQCICCGLRFEVKGRPRDSKLNLSHSTARTFAHENRKQDYHLLVERHHTIRIFSNADIIQHWSQAIHRRDHVDSWVHFPSAWARSHERPAASLRCLGAKNPLERRRGP
jgi:hypothetical protein